MLGLQFCVLVLILKVVGAGNPPTLPHHHHHVGHPYEHLDLATVKGVMEAIEHMWHDYTNMANRTSMAETRLLTTEERLTNAERLCDVEKRALEQVNEVRVAGLERRLQAARGEATAQGACACELASCQHERDAEHNLVQALMDRLDNVWVEPLMQNISLAEKAELTLKSMTWARQEISREAEDKRNRSPCQHPLTTMEPPRK